MLRLLPVVLAASVIFTAGPRAWAGSKCIDDWSVAAPIVKKEGLVTVDKLSKMARAHSAGDILKTLLCDENGNYRYRLIVRLPKGDIKNLSVDAKKPFER